MQNKITELKAELATTREERDAALSKLARWHDGEPWYCSKCNTCYTFTEATKNSKLPRCPKCIEEYLSPERLVEHQDLRTKLAAAEAELERMAKQAEDEVTQARMQAAITSNEWDAKYQALQQRADKAEADAKAQRERADKLVGGLKCEMRLFKFCGSDRFSALLKSVKDRPFTATQAFEMQKEIDDLKNRLEAYRRKAYREMEE